MHETYKMIVVSGFSSLLLLGGLLFYLFVFPRKKVNFLVLLFCVSILPIISIFRLGDYESGDFNTHIYRTIDFYSSLSQGILLPSWASNLNATYGYPLFIFLNPLPYYLQSLFHGFGFSYISSMKITLSICYIFSGIFFYLWAKKETKSSLAAFSGAIVYLFTPYHLVDLHFRVALGETVFFMILPLFFYCFSCFKEKKSIVWFLTSSITFSLLMFSHQAMAIFSLCIIIPYMFYHALQTKQVRKTFSMSLSIIGLGFIDSLYTWIPHIVYPKYTLAYLLSNQTIIFPKFQELLYSPWRFGLLFQGPKGELSYLIGYSQLFILFVGIYLVLKRKVNKTLRTPMFLWTCLSLFLLFMMTPLSSFLWRSVPILNTAQFSTRFLLLLSFTISTIAVYLVMHVKKYYLLISLFLLFTITVTILNWGQRRVIPEITDVNLLTNVSKSTSEGEGFCCMGQPRWTLPDAKWMSIVPRDHLEIVGGKGEVTQIKRTNIYHEYVSYSRNTLRAVDYTWYFPGWKVLIDNHNTKIQVTTNRPLGIISFQIPPGLHDITASYEDPSILFISKCISVLSLSISVLFIIFLSARKEFFNRVNDIPTLTNRHLRKKRQR